MVYKQMAYVYDKFMADAPYDEWVHFTLSVLGNRHINRIADLGCGTGEISTRLAEQGFETIGLDYSEDMLTYAANKANEKKLSITWLHQDLTEMEGLENIDLAVSYCDVMNYITEKAQIKEVFRRTYTSLNPDGIFIFDVHSLYQVEQNYKNQTFADVLEDMSYIWFCSEGEETGEMFHDLTFFVLDKDKYVRFDEYHHERTYPISFYKETLKEVGFTNIKVYADFSLERDQLHEQSERIFFVAEKT
ncbi:class I SAM-dependent methyltransferase [Oceanobacillus sp. Castelsardo]|uniref:class I SAM-dependent DNA methyltransferase n=1 Tax=Oceanobacillus sp. Castelsardo TaxID=1851204 RepID=UPI0008392D04|nr:class I SAM-dependent methyltransferase [Oceanobacillus sp. Castelsardo]